MKIHESVENYLEAILMIQLEKGSARSIDVAHKLEFSKPSVSRAMSLLRENGYITMGKDGLLELTDTGREIAEAIYERHVLFSRWLVFLGVPADVAAGDACRMEHDVSPVTFEKLKEYITAQLPPETATPAQEES
ncbi:MAG: metal-dependent transcriptional regulator [Clostridiales bacterium]|nr:metal-dependent transcriptional regulator [Clostridiales bacterium]